jgi:hypothetical protein
MTKTESDTEVKLVRARIGYSFFTSSGLQPSRHAAANQFAKIGYYFSGQLGGRGSFMVDFSAASPFARGNCGQAKGSSRSGGQR